MKTLIIAISAILPAIGIFYLDKLLINCITGVLPNSAHEWLGLIRIVLWVIAFCWTIGLAVIFGYLGGLVAAAIFGRKEVNKRLNDLRSGSPSKWEQRIAEMQKQQMDCLKKNNR